MRTLAVLFGLIAFAGVVAMAVAGSPDAVAILATGIGIFLMIVLGVRLGGRSSGRAPAAPGAPALPGTAQSVEAGSGPDAAPAAEPGSDGPTAEAGGPG